jgi:uncharacterized protein (TIGR02268 family)
VLLSSTAVAGERTSVVREVVLPDTSADTATAVYVAGGVASVLRFQQPVDAGKTELLGWEGRFEPLVVQGRAVMLFPLRHLEPEDRFLLRVTLEDGTELPFTVTARADKVDHQVNLVPDDDSLVSVRAQLSNALLRERLNRDDAERYRQEKNSVDHSLAALLATGATKQTSFRPRQRQQLDCDGVTVETEWFEGKGKVAVLFTVRNPDAATPWRLGEVRLSTSKTQEARPFALRMDRDEIAPGTTGTVAVVADASAFESKQGIQQLVLEVFRPDGSGQFLAVLDRRLAR